MSSDSDSDSGLSADELAPTSGTIVQVTDFSKAASDSRIANSATRGAADSSRHGAAAAAAVAQGSHSESEDEDDDEDSLSSDESSEEDLDNLRLRRDSKLFSPYRTVGLVTNQTPFQFNAMGKDSFVTVCLGRSWQVLRADSLATSIVSRRLRENIRALAVKRTLTWGAVGRDILLWKRARRVRRIRDAHERPIDSLFLFGEQLLSLSFADRKMKVWHAATSELIGEVVFEDDFTPTCITHPHTYLNKVVIGSREGHVEIWNTRTLKRIFRSGSSGTANSFRAEGTSIACIEQSPALDVLGLGLADGRTILYNIKFDEVLGTFTDSEAARDGGITCLAFHAGGLADIAGKSGKGSAKAPSLVTGSANGKLAVWDLGSRQLLSSLPTAHDGPVSAVAFLPGQPLLLTAGGDNALRQWIFDQGDGSPRLLRHRAGHKYPPRRARYYGGNTVASLADGASGETCQLLSFGGQDRSLWYMHTMREQQSREVSQGKLESRARQLRVDVAALKLPPILDLACSDAKQKDWGNIVTVHEGLPCARVWSFDRLALNPDMRLAPRDGAQPTACAISFCGNFALLGTSSGGVEKFNLQSGLHRGSSNTANAGSSETGDGDSGNSITCIACDGCNRTVITGSANGAVTYWDLKTLARKDTVFCPSGVGITHLRLHDDNNLVAVARADLVVDVHDIVERRVVRRFGASAVGVDNPRVHGAAITDLEFSPDGAWLISASAEGSLFVWDVATARCIEWLRFQAPATSISFSACGSNIATTHVGELGVTVWTNRAAFDAVLLDDQPDTPCLIDLPATLQEREQSQGSDDDSDSDDDMDSDSDGDDSDGSDSSQHDGTDGDSGANPEASAKDESDSAEEPAALGSGIITLSAAPPSNWANLSNLDLIRERNKPTAAPSKPKAAPFFLPSMESDYLAQQVAASSAAAEAAAVAAALGATENVGEDGESGAANGSAKGTPKTQSRLLKRRKMTRPRSKLLCFLLAHPGSKQLGSVHTSPEEIPETATVSEEQRRADAELLQHLLSLTASAVDLEFRTLESVGPEYGGGPGETKEGVLLALIRLFHRLLGYRTSFQVVQAYLDLFVTIFHQDLIELPQLHEPLRSLAITHAGAWAPLENLLQNNLCMLQYFSGQQ